MWISLGIIEGYVTQKQGGRTFLRLVRLNVLEAKQKWVTICYREGSDWIQIGDYSDSVGNDLTWSRASIRDNRIWGSPSSSSFSLPEQKNGRYSTSRAAWPKPAVNLTAVLHCQIQCSTPHRNNLTIIPCQGCAVDIRSPEEYNKLHSVQPSYSKPDN